MKKFTVLFMSIAFSFSANAQTKHALLEEHTGAWCQWCTGGTHTAETIAKNNPNAIPIAIHSADPMAYGVYQTATGLTAAPQANVDRGSQQAGINSWTSLVNTALANTAKADVDVFTSFNSTTRVLTARVKATFYSAAAGDYRLGGIITEDGVHGPSPQYDQSNRYGAGQHGTMGGFEQLPTSIPGYMISYNHVARQLLGGYDGEPNSVNTPVTAGDTASYTFTHTLPAGWNEDYVRVVGVLIAPGGAIDNCNKSTYLDGTNNAAPVVTTEPNTAGAVNAPYIYDLYTSDADDCNLTITATTLPAWLSLGTTTTLGCIHSTVKLSGTPTATGQFPVVLEVSDGVKTTTQSFTITVTPSFSGSWQVVGTPGFANCYKNRGVVTDKNGVVYSFVKESSSGVSNVYKFENGAWTNAGNLNVTDADFGRIVMASDGLTPWVAFGGPSGIYVKKLASSGWSQIGGQACAGVQLGFDLDGNDNPYVAVQDGSQSYYGGCYTYNGSSWLQVGGASYSTAPAVWNDLAVDKTTGDVYVFWTDFQSGRAPYITKYDGSSWSNLGGGAISADAVYFEQSLDVAANGDVYATYLSENAGGNYEIMAYTYNGTSWTNIGSNVSGASAEKISTTINNAGALLVSFLDQGASGKTSAMSYINGNWNFIGPRGFSGAPADYTQIASHQNMPYVLYQDNGASDKATVRYYNAPVISVGEFEDAKVGLHLVPNPANTHTRLPNLAQQEFAIYSISGKLVHSGNTDAQGTINTLALANGLYIIHIANRHVKLTIAR